MSPPPFFVDGGHGSVLLLGWWNWEGGWEKGGRRGIRRFLDLARRAGGAALELDGFTIDHMAARGDARLLEEIARAAETGSLELVGGTYSQAYLATLWEESNLRQFLIGLDAFRARGLTLRTFAYQEPAFHPQLPQILRAFGYDQAVLRTHWPLAGRERSFRAPVIRWRGRDGSTIPAITDPPTLGPCGETLVSRLGDLMLFGRLPLASRAFLRPRLAPPFPSRFRRTTFARWLAGRAPGGRREPPPVLGLDATDARLRLPWGAQAGAAWSALREAEARLLEAEKMACLCRALGRGRFERALGAGWKALLASEAHDFFMCPGLFCPATGERTHRTARRLATVARQTAESVSTLAAREIAAALAPDERSEKSRGGAAIRHGSDSRTGGADPLRLVAFNALNWERAGWVEAEIRSPRGAIARLQVRDGTRPCPSHLDSGRRRENGSPEKASLRFLATLPSLGTKVFHAQAVGDEATTEPPSWAEPMIAVHLAEGRLVLTGLGREVPVALKLGHRPVAIEGLEQMRWRAGMATYRARVALGGFGAGIGIRLEGTRALIDLDLHFRARARVGPWLRAFDDLGKLRLAIPWRGEARRNLPFDFCPAPRRGSFVANDIVYGEDCAVFIAGSPGFHLGSGVLSYPLATSGLFLYGLLALSSRYAARLAIDLDPPSNDAQAMRRVMEWRHPLRAIAVGDPPCGGPPEAAERTALSALDVPAPSASLLPPCQDVIATALFPRGDDIVLHTFVPGHRDGVWDLRGATLVGCEETVVRVPARGIRRLVLRPVAGARESIDFDTPLDLEAVPGPTTRPLPPYLPWRPTIWVKGEPRDANVIVPLEAWSSRGHLRVTSAHPLPPGAGTVRAQEELFLEYEGAAVTSIFDDVPTPVVGRGEGRIEVRARRMRVKRAWLVAGIEVPAEALPEP